MWPMDEEAKKKKNKELNSKLARKFYYLRESKHILVPRAVEVTYLDQLVLLKVQGTDNI